MRVAVASASAGSCWVGGRLEGLGVKEALHEQAQWGWPRALREWDHRRVWAGCTGLGGMRGWVGLCARATCLMASKAAWPMGSLGFRVVQPERGWRPRCLRVGLVNGLAVGRGGGAVMRRSGGEEAGG